MMTNNDKNLRKSPLIQVLCEEIIVPRQNDEAPDTPVEDEPHRLILREANRNIGNRQFALEIPNLMRAEFHTAYHFGIKNHGTVPRSLENLALQFGLHLRRAVLSMREDDVLVGEILTLSDITGEVDEFEVSAEEAVLFAMTHGLPIFIREDLFDDGAESHETSEERSVSLSGKEFLTKAIKSGQLPDEFEPEETLIAIVNLKRNEIIELIELAEDLEYYEWAFHLSAFIDIDETSPGGMDV